MLNMVLLVVIVMVGLVLVFNIICLLVGFFIVDCILVLDMFYINSIVLIVLLGLYFFSDMYFEFVLLIVMFGFVSIVVLVKYLLCGDIIE